MKKNLLFCVSTLVIFLISYACRDQEKIVKSKETLPKLFTVKIVAKLSTTDSLFEKLSRHADISFFGPLKVEEATITKFNEILPSKLFRSQ